MNFYDLSAKLRAIDESSVTECGDMMPTPMIAHAPQQSDSVTMNVSMNGSGAGGIKDLMSILRNIEQSAEHDTDGDVDVVLGTADEAFDQMMSKQARRNHEGPRDPRTPTPPPTPLPVTPPTPTQEEDMLANPDAQSGAGAGDESYGNSAPGGSDAHIYGIDSVTRKGDDMHSKGDVKRLRVNGGENPLQEGLVERLSQMYEEIKTR